MNTDQILEDLNSCINNQHENCCELGKWHEQWNCMTSLMKRAVSTIESQQAEIERLQKYNTDVAFKHYNDGVSDTVKKMRHELTMRVSSYRKMRQIGWVYQIITEVTEELLKTPEKENESEKGQPHE